MDQQGSEAGAELARDAGELRIRMSRLARRLRRDDRGHSLTMAQLSALRRLGRRGTATLSELAAEERVRPQSMARTLDALETAGLVGRVPHPTDRRQNVIRPTCAGHEVIAGNHLGGDTWLARAMVAVLSPEERDLLIRAGALMDRLADYTDRPDGSGDSRRAVRTPRAESAPAGETSAATGPSDAIAGDDAARG